MLALSGTTRWRPPFAIAFRRPPIVVDFPFFFFDLIAAAATATAPAVAAGLLMTGFAASASVYATSAVMATLFGTAGTGLAAYKMHRRTQGLREFSFEPLILDDDSIDNETSDNDNNDNDNDKKNEGDLLNDFGSVFDTTVSLLAGM